jgi:hypothetical protein
MERLPYIDQHSITIGASRERVWDTLASALRTHLSAPAPLTLLLGVTPTAAHRQRSDALTVGDTLPGFAVASAHAPQRLALRGQHRFSRYELAFELDGEGERSCTLRALTSAEFPGVGGRAYRALVIGSRGHRLIVRRMLRDVARRACSP